MLRANIHAAFVMSCLVMLRAKHSYCIHDAPFGDMVKVKGKAVPLHAMEALGGRGIAPTHS
jgi:hypothetical protein